MFVYPVNAIEAFNMDSVQIEAYSLIKDIYNRYISFQVDFTANNILISGTSKSKIEIDSFILGNSNAKTGKLRLYNNNALIYTINNLIFNSYIEIRNINKYTIDKFELELAGTEKISVGYLFFGLKWELPRFVTLPKNLLELRNESDRTFSGQVTGIPTDTLKTFSASYVRINNAAKKLFDDYINGVQTIIPHIIDPYPLAHEQYEPFFATINGYGEATKREENNFFWNFDCSWREAK